MHYQLLYADLDGKKNIDIYLLWICIFCPPWLDSILESPDHCLNLEAPLIGLKYNVKLYIPGMEELGSPGEAKHLNEASILTSEALSRLYRIISAGINAVSPSVSWDKTLPESKVWD